MDSLAHALLLYRFMQIEAFFWEYLQAVCVQYFSNCILLKLHNASFFDLDFDCKKTVSIQQVFTMFRLALMVTYCTFLSTNLLFSYTFISGSYSGLAVFWNIKPL